MKQNVQNVRSYKKTPVIEVPEIPQSFKLSDELNGKLNVRALIRLPDKFKVAYKEAQASSYRQKLWMDLA